MDIVISPQQELRDVVIRLATLGYGHRGNLGIEDREAFAASSDGPSHNLYVCSAGSVALRNHLALRDHLCGHPADAAAYASLKMRLAEEFFRDIDRYVEGKTNFILSILAHHGFSVDQLASIRRANQTDVQSLMLRNGIKASLTHVSKQKRPGLVTVDR